MSIRPRRSALYLPASNAKAIEKARNLPCDVVILDLEDAVAPDAKAMARDQAIAAIRQGGFGDRELVLRVNALNTPWGEDDIKATAAAKPAAILLPKIDTGADVAGYAAHTHGIPLWAMLETARSMLRLEDIASAKNLAALVIGTNDLARELGAQLDTTRTPFLGMLGLAVAAARAYNLAILDGVYNDLDDLDGLKIQCTQAAQFGYDGKTLIHPKQIEICNSAFAPTDAEIEWATTITEAFELPENLTKGVLKIDGRMVERLHLQRARQILGKVRALP